MLEVCASKIGDIILSVLESKMENTYLLNRYTNYLIRFLMRGQKISSCIKKS
jgi:hypothetical protein|nr:MAG TPA: hypothetical protein [Caudoviricetes sp.]